jgi:hypothetical protein
VREDGDGDLPDKVDGDTAALHDYPAGRGSMMIRLGRVPDRFDSGSEVSAVKLPADLAESGSEPLRFWVVEDERVTGENGATRGAEPNASRLAASGDVGG